MRPLRFLHRHLPDLCAAGDEADSPRGRIYLIKDLLESGRPASPAVATHLDRCLTCLSCMSTCPSGVDYHHLVGIGRARLAATHRRPPAERLLRWLLTVLLPHPGRFRWALWAGRLARPLAGLLPAQLGAMLRLLPAAAPTAPRRPGIFAAEGTRRGRVALLAGCAQQVMGDHINAATIRLLTRHGLEVVVTEGVGCCGALVHHMGDEEGARAQARANVAAWTAEKARGGLDAVVINTSGCGGTVKDYGHLLADDPHWAGPAAEIAGLARDVTEVLAGLTLRPTGAGRGVTVAYHSACSLQHGQRIRTEPKRLLEAAGFVVKEVPEGHLCCGSAGTYNLLQPELAGLLRDRKVANIESLAPEVVAGGNLGCLTQIASATGLPVVHSVELLDWATGGARPY